MTVPEGDRDVIADSEHSQHDGHIVLLQGFSLKGMCAYRGRSKICVWEGCIIAMGVYMPKSG